MANPDGSRGGWPSIRRMAVVPLWRQEEGRASDPCQEEGHATSDWSPAPRHATLSQRPPQSRYQLQPYDFERHMAFDFERQPCNADKHCPAEDVPNWYNLIDFNFRYSSSRLSGAASAKRCRKRKLRNSPPSWSVS